MPCSAEASGMRSSRFSSFSACFSASSDMPAFSIASRSSAISAWVVLALAELLLNLAKLLAQDVLALASGKRFLRLLADLLGQPQHLDLLGEIAQQLVEALDDLERLQQVLLLGRREVGDIGDEVGERRRRLDLLDRGRDLGRHVGQKRDRPRARAPSAGACARRSRSNRPRPRRSRRRGRRGRDSPAGTRARGSAACRGRRGDDCRRARSRSAGFRRRCRRDADAQVPASSTEESFCRSTPTGLSALRGRLRAGDRLRAAERERHHDAGEEHDIARRQEDERALGELELRGGLARRSLRRSFGLLALSRRRAFGRLRRHVFGIVHDFWTRLPDLQLGESEHETAIARVRARRGASEAKGLMRRSKRP